MKELYQLADDGCPLTHEDDMNDLRNAPLLSEVERKWCRDRIAEGRTPFQKWNDGDGPRCTPTHVYVASSWRNKYQPAIIGLLKAIDIPCYDFRDPDNSGAPGGFSWRQISPDWEKWTPAQWREALTHPISHRGYNNDRGGMDRSDCCILVLPSGRSAHMEAAYMAAQGKPVFTLALESVEPDLMNLLLGPASHICTTMDELFDLLGVDKNPEVGLHLRAVPPIQ